jgi:hypothetical protein
VPLACRLRGIIYPCVTVAASCAIRSFTMLVTVTALVSQLASSPFEERMQFCKEQLNSISNLKEARNFHSNLIT